MTTNVVFELAGIERVEGSTGDVANGVVVDDWLAGESIGNMVWVIIVMMLICFASQKRLKLAWYQNLR